jgi:hypothetical protein
MAPEAIISFKIRHSKIRHSKPENLVETTYGHESKPCNASLDRGHSGLGSGVVAGMTALTLNPEVRPHFCSPSWQYPMQNPIVAARVDSMVALRTE